MVELDEREARVGMDKARAVVGRLRSLGVEDPEVLGELSATLSDFYVESERCQELIDAFIRADSPDRDRLSEILIELQIGLEHIRSDLKDAPGLLRDLADEVDPDDDGDPPPG